MNNLQWTIEWIATDQWDDEVVLAEIAVAALREVEGLREIIEIHVRMYDCKPLSMDTPLDRQLEELFKERE